LDFLAAALEEVEEASAAAVLTPCVKLPLIVAAINKSLVLPARCANHPLSRVASGPSAPNRLGLRASVKSCCCPWPELEELEEGGGDAEKCRSERVRGRAVAYALGGLLGAKSYDVGEACCDSCSVSSSVAPGAPRSASRIRWRPRSLFPCPSGGRGRGSGVGGIGGV
jgi:hypothetical protein